MEKQKVTVFLTTEMGFGVISRQAYLVEHGLTDYAQYRQVPYVVYVPKGKRTAYRHIKGYKPFMLVIDGWQDLDVPNAFNVKEEGGMVIKQSKYSSFDEGYITDFNTFINPLIATGKLKVVADYRYEKEGMSLFDAIQKNDKGLIEELNKRADAGQPIRIM